jgi:beta-1,4-N-acetylglucosaminyltransferase
MHVFVTVGTTRFDALVNKVITEDVQRQLKAKGYNTLTLQTGKSPFNNKGIIVPANYTSRYPVVLGRTFSLWKGYNQPVNDTPFFL